MLICPQVGTKTVISGSSWLLPIASFFTPTMRTIALVVAKTYKEAQSYRTRLTFVVIIPLSPPCRPGVESLPKISLHPSSRNPAFSARACRPAHLSLESHRHYLRLKLVYDRGRAFSLSKKCSSANPSVSSNVRSGWGGSSCGTALSSFPGTRKRGALFLQACFSAP